MEQYLHKVLPFLIKKLLKEKKNVLVHCHAGKQRSAAVVAALLFILQDCPNNSDGKAKCMNNVINYIRNCRPQAFSFGLRVNFRESLENYFKIKI